MKVNTKLKNSVLLPLIALIGGAAGFVLRSWLFAVKDKGGLVRRDHPASWLLLVLSIVVVAAVYFLTRDIRTRGKYYDHFPTSYVGGIGAAAAAVGLFFSVLATLIDRENVLASIGGFVGLLAVFSLAFTGICRITHHRPNFIFNTSICLFLAFYQLGHYRSWIGNPEMQEYAYELLACICLMIAAYQRAAFDLNMGRRKSQYFWSLCGVFFAMVSMAGTGSKLFYGSLALWAITNLAAFPKGETAVLSSSFGKEKASAEEESAPDAEEVPAEETPEVSSEDTSEAGSESEKEEVSDSESSEN